MFSQASASCNSVTGHPCYDAFGTHPTGILSCYRPQQSCGQGNVFTRVCHSVHRGWVGVSASVHAPLGADTPWSPWEQTLPPGADTPPEQTPPQEQTPPWSRHLQSRHPPGADTPMGADPPRADTPWEQTPPGSRHPPPREADSGIRSMSGRYVSYWNAFLYIFFIRRKQDPVYR